MSGIKYLLEEVYRHFYSLEWMTPKQMANLICDNDPRVKSLKYSNPDYKNTLQAISDAVRYNDLAIEGHYSVNSKINTHALFRWACRKYKQFRHKLPIDMIPNTGEASGELSALTCHSFNLDLPDNYQELRQEYANLYNESLELKEEIKRLSVFEKKKIDKLNDSAKGGRKSKGTPKERD